MKIALGVYGPDIHPYHYNYIDDSWVLSDIEPRADHIEKIDARDIPYENVEALYASHVLEHIKYDEVVTTLIHWHDVLKEGGWVHINVPNIEWGLDALMKLNCGEKPDSVYFDSREKVMDIFNGNDGSEHDIHKSWFTKEKLEGMLEKAGFKEINVSKEYEAHDMECLIARAYK